MYKYLVILKGIDKDLSSYELEILWYTYLNEKIKLKRKIIVFTD